MKRLGDRGRRCVEALGAVLLGVGVASSPAAETTGARVVAEDAAELRWTPSTGAVSAYVVFVSRNGGPFRSEQYTPGPFARVAGQPGETIRVRVQAYGVEGDRTLESAPSEPSAPIQFAAVAASAEAAPAKPAPSAAGPIVPAPVARAPGSQVRAADGVRSIPGFQLVPPLRVEAGGDFDGDGDFDLLATLGSWRHPLVLFLEDGSLDRVVALPSQRATTHALAADFDGDGQDEVALQGAREVVIVAIEPSGQLATRQRLPVSADTRLIAADLDGDGSATLLAYEPKTGRLVEQRAGGGADFGSILPLHTLLAGDFDGDGRDDLWVQARPGASADVWLMDPAGGFRVAPVRLSRAPSAAAVADVNGDGRADLAGYDPTSDELHAWLLDGARVVSERTLARGPVESLRRGDIDGDGLDDLLLRAPDGAATALILSQ